MKIITIMAAVLVMSVAASAQVSSPVSLYVGGAVSLPQSPDQFSEAYKMGFHGSVGLGFNVMPKLQLVGKLEYHRFALDMEDNSTMSGGHNNMLMFGADARFAFGLPVAPVKPYILGGLGLARISTGEFEGSDPLVTSLNDFLPEAQTDLYFNVGAGVELKSGPMFGLFAQARYVQVATEGESSSFIPITLGLKFF